MNITLNKKEIKKALEIVKGGVENNSNHLILSYVLIEIKNQILTITTTNSEIEIKTKNNINSTNTANFILSSIDINNIISKLDEDIDINFSTTKEEKIIITTKQNKFELNTLKNYNFQTLINENEIIEKFKINTKNLYNIIHKTKFSIANDNPQKYLNGLFLSITKEQILAASSDGHRLSIAKSKQLNDVIENKNSIIPKKTVDEITKLLNETSDENVEIAINENYIIINTKDTIISSKLIDGNYPDYKQILPNTFDNNILINRKVFEKSLKQVEIFTKETKTIKLNFKDDKLIITTNSEKGSAKSELNTKNFKGEIIINFNVSYLIKTLENLQAENIILNIDDTDAKVIVINNENDDNYKYLIMSIKI